MANLRGGSFQKQIKDAFHRLERFGQGRHGKDDHFTHSLELAKKREMYLRDFAKFAENTGLDGKLNSWMGDQNIMKDRWINMGFEESELKPYKEPSKDVLDQGRIGKCAHARTARLFFSPNPFVWLTVLCFCKGSHLSTSTLICIKWPVDMLMST